MEFIFALIGYLLGSIPFGLILTKAAGLGDIRAIGSGNIGATNVLRTGNKKLAAATLILDGTKGAVAVLLAQHFANHDAALMAGLFSILGHVFPIWLNYKGGKGVATALGMLLALAPLSGLAACGVWLVMAAVFRFSSLYALIALL
jgi:glycerol-3-phosphate acyltransferase PlsY